uniref:Uncharacterized protein n=1 Tax=Dicentrarchus labrax TaxID=13489 RepID=A0A8P4GF50_DICLA
MVEKILISQHAKYSCSFCGKAKMKSRPVPGQTELSPFLH